MLKSGSRAVPTEDASQMTRESYASPECPNCASSGMRIFHNLDDVPVNSCVLLPRVSQALEYPKGNIRLGFCTSCGFISNSLFDPQALSYSSTYEETQGFSPRFKAFIRQLALRLIDRYDLRGKQVLEIGCGKGEFLGLLCELGDNRGIGIDPSYVRGRISAEAESQITFITDYYSEKYSALAGDFVCCRHTLEHIQPTRDFLFTVARSLEGRKNTPVFFEVPDVSRVLHEPAFWDIYYEHCSYFSLGSLARLFRSCGFEVLDLYKDYDDQYLLIEARLGDGTGSAWPAELDLPELTQAVDYFEKEYARKLDQWSADLTDITRQGQRPVLWGSGSKAVSYLTTLRIKEEIEFVVDINPFKHGMYLAGTGHQIVAPEFLKEYKPDVVIVMNPIYREEIQEQLRGMGVSARIVAV